ncbi:hypothetical protein SAMN04487948_11661 [Halogranum amylolyticum]|uniref:Uncharacterized protein n=1 Tax=Halogranum amylolyticum TaxID=660520 RepID=A0A1H8VFS5_9EURY|nr:hypothetical protein [Halogranum amylolyticum]SEP14249.1 hypothetical protein SAMN04487948_11661 [Halogranum amylolyticum]
MATLEVESVEEMNRFEEMLATLADNREFLSVVGYFVMVLVTSAFLAPMLGIAWTTGGLAFLLVNIPVELGLIGLPPLSVLLIGVWLGLLLLLLLFDMKKRLQGLFLVIGTLVALLGLCSVGLVCGNLNLFDNLEWLGAGLLVGTVLGGGRDLPSLLDNQSVEFRDAAQWVFYLGSLLVIAGFVEAHIQYPLEVTGSAVTLGGSFGLDSPPGRSALFDAALTGTFVYTLGKFIQYDAETDLFILGPSDSGKSLLLLGAYYQASENINEKYAPQPNTEFYQVLGEVDDNLRRMNNSGDIHWPVAGNNPDESKNIGFEFVHGSAFPKNVEVHTVDYAGEWLEFVPDVITMDNQQLDQYLDEEGYDNLDVLLSIKRGIKAADVLVFLIDVEKHVAGEPLEIGTYHEICEKTSGKRVLLIATKCDLLAEQFEQETGLDPLLQFTDFQQYVQERLTRRQQVQSLVNQAAGSMIHPVWYQTREHSAVTAETENNVERIPSLTEDGQMVPVGFDQLLDHFGRGR